MLLSSDHLKWGLRLPRQLNFLLFGMILSINKPVDIESCWAGFYLNSWMSQVECSMHCLSVRSIEQRIHHPMCTSTMIFVVLFAFISFKPSLSKQSLKPLTSSCT